MDDLSIVRASKMLFARKFDPGNDSSMQLISKIVEWRKAAEDMSNTVLAPKKFMLRIKDGLFNHSDIDMCMQGKADVLADKVKFVRCNPNDRHQWFALDSCHGNAYVYLRDGLTPALMPLPGTDIEIEEPAAECSLMMLDPNIWVDEEKVGEINEDGDIRVVEHPDIYSEKYHHLCLDINGQNYMPFADLISWECTGQWNQLFKILPNGAITATLPTSLRRIRDVRQGEMTELCIEARDLWNQADFQAILQTCNWMDPTGGRDVEDADEEDGVKPFYTRDYITMPNMQFEAIFEDGTAIGKLHTRPYRNPDGTYTSSKSTTHSVRKIRRVKKKSNATATK